MADIFRTLIVPDSFVSLARQIAASFGPGGEGMWTTPLTPTDANTATHYISTGYIPEQFAYLVPNKSWSVDEESNWVVTNEEAGDAVAVYNFAVEAEINCEQEDIDALFAAVDVSDQEPFVAMARLNLKILSLDLNEV